MGVRWNSAARGSARSSRSCCCAATRSFRPIDCSKTCTAACSRRRHTRACRPTSRGCASCSTRIGCARGEAATCSRRVRMRSTPTASSASWTRVAGCSWPATRRRGGAARAGTRAVARLAALRRRVRGVCAERDRAARGVADRLPGGALRGATRARWARGARERARAAGRRAPASRAPPRQSHARALPIGQTGRRADGVPRRTARAARRTRPRTESRAPRAGAGDPPTGAWPRT